MHVRLAFLMLPYTRFELPHWDKLLTWAGADWRSGVKPDWAIPPVKIRGKTHGFLMNLDRSDWCQRLTYFTGRYYEFSVLRTMNLILRSGDHFIDIGANIRMITLHGRKLVGPRGSVQSFEPNPPCATAIREHVRINGISNVAVHECALSDEPGTLVLSMTSEHSGTATLAHVGEKATQRVAVQVKVADSEITAAPRLIKIDVEGFELQVLRGLRGTLTRHKPFLITELIEEHLNKAGSTAAQVKTFLAELGYEGFAIQQKRRRRRQRLVLEPLGAVGKDDATDVLWAHPSQKFDATRYCNEAISSEPLSFRSIFPSS